MSNLILSKYSMGIGDRFGRQGRAQLSAFVEAKKLGVEISPVWNKSNREHLTVKTEPSSVRAEADSAVRALNWSGAYHVDADHIGLKTVDRFVAGSDFYTLDVADFVGHKAADADIEAFVASFKKYIGELSVPGIEKKLTVTADTLRTIGGKYCLAIQEVGKLYRHIEAAKGKGKFITEVSMDETDMPQSPLELFFILGAIAQQGVPAQTIAPKFTGRFNKGVDYVGDLKQFETEFNDDLAVIALAIKEFGLPANLKLSVHSGSDKFSIYPIIGKAIRRHNAGLHLKTAGTTWLEELIGLAEAGGEGLEIAKEVYTKALARFDELCAPYATVIDIDPKQLPTPQVVAGWTSQQYVNALRHEQSCKEYNRHFRQMLHVGYKVAAELGDRYLNALAKYETVVSRNVAENVFKRHLKRVFID